MLASSHFKISRTRADDWFDTILDADTELFVDPFLVFREKRGFWSGRIVQSWSTLTGPSN